MRRRTPYLLALAACVAGCRCQLSGTPLDTMEKRFNPACWWAELTYEPEPAPSNGEPAPETEPAPEASAAR